MPTNALALGHNHPYSVYPYSWFSLLGLLCFHDQSWNGIVLILTQLCVYKNVILFGSIKFFSSSGKTFITIISCRESFEVFQLSGYSSGQMYLGIKQFYCDAELIVRCCYVESVDL